MAMPIASPAKVKTEAATLSPSSTQVGSSPGRFQRQAISR